MAAGVFNSSGYYSVKTSHSFTWWRPGVAQLLIGVLAFLLSEQIGAKSWWVPGGFILICGVALLPNLYWALTRPTSVILADHLFVLVGAYLVYFVIGAMLLPLGPHDEAEYSLSYYPVDASVALRVAAVNAIGIGLALIGSAFAPRRMFARLGRSAVRVGYRIPLEWVIAGFLLVGLYSYLYVLKFDISPPSDAVISGSWRTLANLLLAAVVLATAHRGRGARFLRIAAIGIVFVQAIGGVLMLNKSQALMPIVALCIGYAWRVGIKKVALPGLIVLLSLFLLIGSPVTAARNLLGSAPHVDWSSRISVLWAGFFEDEINSIESDYYPWARFCYTPPQAAAMDLYDAGRGGDDFENAGWVFFPRFLFPQKPVITATGREFHHKLTGNLNSSTGQGVFVNGYYNLGMLGVIISGLGVGLMLGCTSSFAKVVLERRAHVWLPFALLGSFMAFRIDGFFLGDYLGPFSLILYSLLGGTLAAHFVYRSRYRT